MFEEKVKPDKSDQSEPIGSRGISDNSNHNYFYFPI